ADYYRDKESVDTPVIRNMMLALSDCVSEIAQALWETKKMQVSLWGTGILGYYIWRLLNVYYPNVRVLGFVSPQPPTQAGVFEVIVPPQVQQYWGDAHLKVMVDLPYYASGLNRFGSAFRPDVKFFEHSDTADDSGEWDYHFLAGDYDRTIPSDVSRY